MYIHIHTCMHTFFYIYIYIYVCVYVYIYIYIHIYTHVHIHIVVGNLLLNWGQRNYKGRHCGIIGFVALIKNKRIQRFRQVLYDLACLRSCLRFDWGL